MPAGRPTVYRKEYVETAKLMCRLGATEIELADEFGVTCQTIRNWNRRYPEFFSAQKLGKAEADQRVTKSLYHRAVGYTFNSVKVAHHNGDPVKIPYREHMPPDTAACIFWLKNRRPDLWRDKIDMAAKHDHRHAHVHASLDKIAGQLTDQEVDVLEGVYRKLAEAETPSGD